MNNKKTHSKIKKHSLPINVIWFARIVLPAVLMFILLIIALWFHAIPSIRENLVKSKKEMIAELTNSGHALMNHYYERAISGELTEAEAKERLKERIRHLRYGPGQAYYFWIIDLQPLLIVHPYNVDLIDKDISEYENPDFRDVVRAMAEICWENNEGFLEYQWEWLGDPDRIEPKIAYVRIFEPWEWIIGTGVYMKDVEETISRITKQSNRVFTYFGLMGLIFAAFISINGVQTENKLIKAKEMAEESNRLKSAFLANMSHEIRTPMNGILGFAELPRNKDIAPDKQQKYLEIINKSGIRMLNIINDLVDISRIEAGQIELSERETDIRRLTEYLETFFGQEANNKGIKLKSDIPANTTTIIADEEKLCAIMSNLIKNAIKYTEQGTIIFGFACNEEIVEFFVEDTGPGIKILFYCSTS